MIVFFVLKKRRCSSSLHSSLDNLNRATFLGAISLLIPSNVLLDSTSIVSSPSPSLVLVATSAATADPYSAFANYVRSEVAQKVQQDPSLAGPLIRLAFHDAATLESAGPGVKLVTGGPNAGSIRYEARIEVLDAPCN
jgi:hypothetical protein